MRIDEKIRAFCQVSSCRIHNIYGPTEASFVTAKSLTGDPAGWPAYVPIGRLSCGMRAYVLDEYLRPAGPGEVGELYVTGPLVAHGYWQRPWETAQRFLAIQLAVFKGW